MGGWGGLGFRFVMFLVALYSPLGFGGEEGLGFRLAMFPCERVVRLGFVPRKTDV